MVPKSCSSWYGEFPIICTKVLYIPGGAGFLFLLTPRCATWEILFCRLVAAGWFQINPNYIMTWIFHSYLTRHLTVFNLQSLKLNLMYFNLTWPCCISICNCSFQLYIVFFKWKGRVRRFFISCWWPQTAKTKKECWISADDNPVEK